MRAVLLLLAEVVAVAVVVVGVALIYVPAGLILAGLVGVVAAERSMGRGSK